MSFLQKIQQTVQKTAEAMAEVLKVEVEVADTGLVRVAATGQFREKCGQVMLDSFVYRHVLQTLQTVLIENPGHHELCKPCINQGNCPESAELAVPILLRGQAIGVIGLVSFDDKQTKILMDNKEWMLQFVIKMAELIAGNLPAAENGEADEKMLKLDHLEKEAIVKALAEVSGAVRSKELAAKMLGISRATLYRKIKEYELM